MAALLFLYLVRGILLPFVVAFVIAALLEPAVRKLRMRGMSRKSSVLIVMGVLIFTDELTRWNADVQRVLQGIGLDFWNF